ncbi:MAG: reverse gyrase, partial [Thermoprotei archaeon]
TMWSAQRAWARRVIKKRSFAILAPTGVGKTVFGILLSLYLADRGERSYIVLPTTLLVRQVWEKTISFAEKVGSRARILGYHGRLTRKEKVEFRNRLLKGEFDILITTSQFLARNIELLKNIKFHLIFVDDVDALLKSSKNIDRVLILLGFSEDIIHCGLRLINLKREIAYRISRREEVSQERFLEIETLRREIEDFINSNRIGVLIVSTATGKVKGQRVKLFRELLNFEVGSRAEFLRNISDIYVLSSKEKLFEDALNLVKKLGKGGLIFVPVDEGIETAKKLVEYMNSNGIKAALVYAKEKGALEGFLRGEIDVLVGVAIYYGLLVRGLDYPEVIRYAIFVGVPRFKFSMLGLEPNPIRMLQLLTNIRELLKGDDARFADRYIAYLRRILADLDRPKLMLLLEALNKGVKLVGSLGRVQERVHMIYKFIRELVEKEYIREKLKTLPYVSIEETDKDIFIRIPDAMTYLQAAGRTSRMFAGGISKGISIVIVDDEKLLSGLIRQTKWYSEDVEWKSLDEVDLELLIKEVDRDRDIIRRILAGKVIRERAEPLKTALLLVESPNKARTIAHFFGRPSIRRLGRYSLYEVGTGDYLLGIIASGGHVCDLITREGIDGVLKVNGDFIPVYTSIKKCQDCGEQFTDEDEGRGECPACGSKRIFDSADTVNAIKEFAQEVDLVVICTDPDTEGEKIGWDLATLLSPYVNDIRRAEFHEVTKRAVINALSKLRDIDVRLVEAQIVRRIEDRWIGFGLSRKLWEKFNMKTLSAGRVQTPVLGWIIERYNEHLKSVKRVYFVRLENGLIVRLDNVDERGRKPKEVRDELKSYRAVVEKIDEREESINPLPPYSTDSMLREATQRLRVGVDTVMRIAQDLFELGLITYHRTDSTRVSSTGRNIAREYIAETFGEEYFIGREWMREGAHECIRPTRPIDSERLMALIREGILRPVRPLTRRHFILYDLIFRRFIASQMPPAKVRRVKYRITIGPYSKEIEGYVRITEDGFMKIYKPIRLLEGLEEGEYEIDEVRYRKIATIPLYTQADIIRLMKEKNIGRPSTYAKIVKTLLDRRYIIETKNRKLVPTSRGIEVYKFLLNHYEHLVSEERTRVVEDRMQAIEEGRENYKEVLREFFEEIQRALI